MSSWQTSALHTLWTTVIFETILLNLINQQFPFFRWRAYRVLQRLPAEPWDEMRNKIAAYDHLDGTRKYCDYSRRWMENYLATYQENPNSSAFVQSLNNLRSQCGFKVVLFSAFIVKINQHMKSAERAILVTENNIYKLDIAKFKALKSPMSLEQVWRIDCVK